MQLLRQAVWTVSNLGCHTDEDRRQWPKHISASTTSDRAHFALLSFSSNKSRVSLPMVVAVVETG